MNRIRAMESTRNPKRRERLLLVLFPAALVLAGYSVFVVIPSQKQLRDQQAKFEVAKAQAVSLQDAELSQAQLEQTKLGLQRLKATVAGNREKLKHLGQGWRRTDSRLATFQQITEMLRLHDLSVVFQGYMSELNVSAYNHELVDIIARQDPQNGLKYWQIELQGSFPNVTKFLDSINSEQLGIIPVSVTMKPSSKKPSDQTWTIVFLI
jgi:hypothetical protein